MRMRSCALWIMIMCRWELCLWGEGASVNQRAMTMQSKHPFLSSLALAAVLALPAVIAIPASVQAQRAVVQIRVYDRYHRDYHNWDDREDRAYRGYFVEQRRPYRVYRRLNRPEQRQYWVWRHGHPDHDNRR